jgi:hypothetical protein
MPHKASTHCEVINMNRIPVVVCRPIAAHPVARFVMATALALTGAMSLMGSGAQAERISYSFIVNSAGDGGVANPRAGTCDDGTGHCTLRAALQLSQLRGSRVHTITFDLPGFRTSGYFPGPPVIKPASPLPTITTPTTVAGTTESKYHRVIIDGANAGPATSGLTVAGGPSVIAGLIIRGFGMDGIDVSGAELSTRIVANTVENNGGEGILLDGVSGVEVGDAAAGDGNVITGNGRDGLAISGGSANIIAANHIGVSGATAAANKSDGIIVAGSSSNTIGGSLPGQGNVVSGNDDNGIEMLGGSANNTVEGNLIGVGPSGSGRVPNCSSFGGNYDCADILLNDVAGSTIGGTAGTTPATGCTGRCNVISASDEYGIHIMGISAMNNQVQGNYIGTDASGTSALGSGYGIWVDNASNTEIGGVTQGAENLISGNRVGVQISGAGASGNKVQGNLIGATAAGAAALANGNGVNIVDSSNNTVGGTAGTTPGGPCTGACNVISGNTTDGLNVGGQAAGNSIQGNFVGVNQAGSAALANGNLANFIGDGILIQAPGNTVGGTQMGAGNVISGNVWNGLVVATSGTTIQGNRIATSADGSTAIPNPEGGLIVDGPSNTIGGTTGTSPRKGCTGACNLISGNTGTTGLDIGQGDSNVVQGNYVGTDRSGQRSLPNNEGILVHGVADTKIGGSRPGEGNVVSGNLTGIAVAGTNANTVASGTAIQGNLVGTTADGKSALPNTGSFGIVLSFAPLTIVGGPGEGVGNVISGNANLGLLAEHPESTGVVIQGNRIGVDLTGRMSLANGDSGVELDQTVGTLIGGSRPGAGNVITSSGADGIDLEGATGIVVERNRIGTEITGTKSFPNQQDGVAVNGGVGDQIGGPHSSDGNLVSGNLGNGVAIFGMAHDDSVRQNRIGVDATGTKPIPNQGIGVLINKVPSNRVSDNVISGNEADGVIVLGPTATNNVITGNLIGIGIGSTLVPNRGNGVTVGSGASQNHIGGTRPGMGNTIESNRGTGVFVGSANQDMISHNSICANHHRGITLATGANLGQPHPVLKSTVSTNGSTKVEGTLHGAAGSDFRVELFRSPHCDPSGFGQGKVYLASTRVHTNGAEAAEFIVTVRPAVAHGSALAATATDAKGNTSDFSKCLPVR